MMKNKDYIEKMTQAHKDLLNSRNTSGKSALILKNDGSLVGYYKNLRKLYDLMRHERATLIETCKIGDDYMLGVEFNEAFKFYIYFGCPIVLSKFILRLHRKIIKYHFFNITGADILDQFILQDNMEKGFLCKFYYPLYSDWARVEVIRINKEES